MKRISGLAAFFISLCALLQVVSAFAPIARFLDDNPEGIPGEDYPVFRSVPRGLHFGCNDKKPGFYADPETRCQVWHLCDTFGRRHSFICPNQTVFNQLIRGCDWWYNVDCDNARDLYWNNDELFREHPDNQLGFQGRRAGGTASRGEQNNIASDVVTNNEGDNSVNPFSVSVSPVSPNLFSVSTESPFARRPSTESSFVRRPSTVADQGGQDFNNGVRQPQQVKVVRRPVTSTPLPETFPPETFPPQTSTLPPFPTRNFNRNRFFTNPPVTTTIPPPTTVNAFLPWSSTFDPFAFDPPIDTFAPNQNLNDPSSDDGPPTSWTVRFIAGNVNPSISSPFSFEPQREDRAQNFGQEGDSNADNSWSWRLAENQERGFISSSSEAPLNDGTFPSRWQTSQPNAFQGFSSTPRSAHNFDDSNNKNNNNDNNNNNNNINNIRKNTNSQNNVHPPAFQNTLRPIVNSHNNNFAPAFQSNPRPIVNSHNDNFAPAFQSTPRPKFTPQDRNNNNNNNNNNFPPAFQSTPRPFLNTQPHEYFSPAFQSTPQPAFSSSLRSFGNTDTDDNIGSFSSTSGDFVDNNEVTTFGSTRRSFHRGSDSFDSNQFLQSSTPISFSVSTNNHVQDSVRTGSSGFSRVPFVPSSTAFPIRSSSQRVPDWLTSSLPDDNSLSHVPTLTVDFSPDFEDTTNSPSFTSDVPREQSSIVPFKITTYHPRARFNDVTTTPVPTLPPTTTTTAPRRRRPTRTTTAPPPTEPETTPMPTTTTPEPGVPLAYGARIQPRLMVRASVINDNSVAGSSVHETSVAVESKPVAKTVYGGYDLVPLADGSSK